MVQTNQLVKSYANTEPEMRCFGTIFNNVSDAIIVVDSCGFITDCNISAENMFGKTREELVKQNISQLSVQLNISINDIVSKREDGRVEYTFAKNDGTQFYAKVSLAPLFVENSYTAGYVLVLHNITKEKEFEQRLLTSEGKFRALFEASEELIFLLASDLTIANVNPFVTHYLGYKREFLLGQDIGSLFFKNGEEKKKKFGEQIKKFGTFRGDIAINKYRSSSVVILDCSISSVKGRQGEDIAFVAFLRDITERKRVEKIKDDFVSSVSHELRTPLTSILGSLRLLQFGIAKGNYEKTSALLDLAYCNSEKLLKIINEILDIGKIESGGYSFSFDNHPLELLLKWSVELCGGLSDKYNGSIKLSKTIPNAHIYVDKDRFLQVMFNLISNALKFSPEDSIVKIDARLIKDGGNVKISIRDKGGGIPISFRARVFEKFAQADTSYARKNEGTGLGLSIAKELVENMNGAIGYRSKENKGTTFYVVLPVAKESSQK